MRSPRSLGCRPPWAMLGAGPDPRRCICLGRCLPQPKRPSPPACLAGSAPSCRYRREARRSLVVRGEASARLFGFRGEVVAGTRRPRRSDLRGAIRAVGVPQLQVGLPARAVGAKARAVPGVATRGAPLPGRRRAWSAAARHRQRAPGSPSRLEPWRAPSAWTPAGARGLPRTAVADDQAEMLLYESAMRHDVA